MPVRVTQYDNISGKSVLAGKERRFVLDLTGSVGAPVKVELLAPALVIHVESFADAQRVMAMLEGDLVVHNLPAPVAAPAAQVRPSVPNAARAPTAPSPAASPPGAIMAGTHCGVCLMPQLATEAGPLCTNGHAGAPAITPEEARTEYDRRNAAPPRPPLAMVPKPVEPAPAAAPLPAEPAQSAPQPEAAPAAAASVPSGALSVDELPDQVKRATGVHHLVTWCWENRGLRTVDELVAAIEPLQLGCVRRAGDQLRARVQAAVTALAAAAAPDGPTPA